MENQPIMLASLLMCVLCGVAAAAAPEIHPRSQPATQTEPITVAPGDVWHLSFHLSGGFAGIDRELQLDSTGKIGATDRRRSLSASSRASASELARVRQLLISWPAPQLDDGGCRDCLIYEVHLTTGKRSLNARLNDVSLAASGLADLVETLKQVLTRTLAP